MRPVSIQLQAFGPYPGNEQVDFTALLARGLFVVSGDTGAGKTSIFDAMSYALYGKMATKDGRDVRSHHADADVPTYVRFTFDSDGSRYVVERRPEQERRAKRGTKTTVDKATALLARLTGDTSESLATRSHDVDRHCLELIGLDAEQFQRVVLLPQGEFAKFLLAGSKEREDLLGQLFGGDIFEIVLDEVKQRESALRHEVGDIDIEINHRLSYARTQVGKVFEQLGDVPPVALDQCERDALELLVADANARLDVLAEVIQVKAALAADATALVVKAQGEAERFDRTCWHRAQLSQLKDVSAEIEAGDRAARMSKDARPVVEADRSARTALVTLGDADRRRAERLVDIEHAFADLGATVDSASAVSVTQAVNAQCSEIQRWVALADARDTAAASVTQTHERLEQLRRDEHASGKQLTDAVKRRQHLEQHMTAVAASGGDLVVLDAEINAAQLAFVDRRELDELAIRLVDALAAESEAVAVYHSVLAGFVATQAPRLAAQLIPGEPCAVCGSSDHPAPASGTDVEPTGFDHVEAAGVNREAVALRRQDLEREIAALRARLGSATQVSAEILDARVAVLRERRAAAAEANRAHGLLVSELTSLVEVIEGVTVRRASIEGSIRSTNEMLTQRQQSLTVATEAVAGIDPDRLLAATRIVDELGSLCRDIEALFDSVTAAAESVRVASAARDRILADSPFDSVEVAAAAVLAPDIEQSLVLAGENHRRDLAVHVNKLELLAQQGSTDERPDLDTLNAIAAELRRDAEQTAELCTTARNARDDAARELIEHDFLVAESGELRERYGVVRKAAHVCAEGGVLRMPLRRWVLAIELDRVTSAANMHLQRMTSGRYRLQRRHAVVDGRKAFGLEIEVFDTHTGRERSTSSMSGGEQFQASLALALGLADVVSHGGSSSGKRFEALFVDEGFGSLDPVALQDAIDALHQLQATGRMVGAITHVEEMKRCLHVGIEVRRLADGRGSTIVVHP